MATCNAGHGCSITCPDGCGAIYVEPNGPCHTWCEGDATMLDELQRAEMFSVDFHDLKVGPLINVLDLDLDDDRKQQIQRGEKRLTLSMKSTSLREFTAEVERQLS